eukprot:12054143-Karenia_brevis.AAC.1
MLEKSDGQFTANVEEMDKLMRDAWLPVFQKFSKQPEPAWEAFTLAFGKYIKQYPMSTEEIKGEELAEIIGKMRHCQAPGMDGWRAGELKALPPLLIDLLAELLNVAEK